MSYLVDRTEHVDEFDDAATEKVELSEDMGFIKIELPSFGHRPQLVLHKAVPGNQYNNIFIHIKM